MMNFGSGIIVILSIMMVCEAYAPAANPPMLTHASMDVGNIISIVIPESPDENINVDQLTGEFRQQLERIKKQSRASKVEHGLVTLKRVLPEMSREEKRKTLPLIRRVLHGRRVANPGIPRNWTRDPRLDQFRESGQYVHSRSAINMDERRIHRDYEEMGNRDTVTSRGELANRDDYRRINERAFANRREDSARRDEQTNRENMIRPSVENLRQDETSLRRDENTERRDDRGIFSDDQETGKIVRSQQDWNNPNNWDEQTRPDASRLYPETSTADCDYKLLERSVRQKDPANEIIQSDKFDKIATGRLGESGMINSSPEEMSAECTKIYQRLASSRFPVVRTDVIDSSKRAVKEFRRFEAADLPTFVNLPRDFDVNPNCDDNKKNHTNQFPKDSQTIVEPVIAKMPQATGNFDSEDYRVGQKIAQTDSQNITNFENNPNDGSYNYAIKKKRGHDYFQDPRVGVASMREQQALIGNRWNSPNYEERQPMINSSEEIRDTPNVYEMFGEKTINPGGLSYVQTEQGGFRSNNDNERKNLASPPILNYGNAGLAMRIQRAINMTATSRGQFPKLNLDKSIFEQLKRFLKIPQSPVVTYNRVILVYGNENDNKSDDDKRETITEAEKTQFTSSPSMVEPSSSTSHDLPQPDRSMTQLPQIDTSKNIPAVRAI